MEEKSKVIFGNPMPDKVYRKAVKSKKKYAKKFGDDAGADYPAIVKKNEYIGDMLGVHDIRVGETGENVGFDTEKGIIVGNIRMGFGHYRISMAIASAAHSMGYVPYWMDLNSYPQTTCTKVIGAQNDLYSLGSRLSQKSRLFNRLVWEPMNYEGFRKLSYNAADQKNAELMAPVYANVPKEDLIYTGHYIDHELVSNIEADCEARRARKREKKPVRFLLTIGGAGAQREIFASIIKHLLPAIEDGRAALYVNVGDYRNVWEELLGEIPGMKNFATEHFNNWKDTTEFAAQALTGEVSGIHGFWHENIFEAVYCTNLLMRSCDVLVTKPSELAFYPVPKLFIKRVGGHEQWGAIHSAEIGDGTLECRDIPHTVQMLDLFLNEDTLLNDMCDCIEKNKAAGIYDGAYRVVELAMEKR